MAIVGVLLVPLVIAALWTAIVVIVIMANIIFFAKEAAAFCLTNAI